jgi:hypothetical protein
MIGRHDLDPEIAGTLAVLIGQALATATRPLSPDDLRTGGVLPATHKHRGVGW